MNYINFPREYEGWDIDCGPAVLAGQVDPDPYDPFN